MFKDKGPPAGLSLQGMSAISRGYKDCIAGGCKGNFQYVLSATRYKIWLLIQNIWIYQV